MMIMLLELALVGLVAQVDKMNYKIKALTYPEQRLEYFKAQIESAKRSLDWWQNHAASRGYNSMDIHDRCSELGCRISFYQDAIEALEPNKEN